MVFGFLFLIPMALVLGCLVGLTYLWVRVLRNPGGGEPSCGSCGYAVQGLSALTCPECGSDFRRVGIDTPRQRGSVGPGVFSTLWTLMLPMPALAAIGLTMVFGPKQQSTSETVTLTPEAPSGYADIRITSGSYAAPPWGSQSSLPELNLAMQVSGTSAGWATMSVDLSAFTFQDHTSMTVPAPLDEQAVLSWMGAAGVNTADADVQAQAKELFRILRRAPAHGLKGVSASHFSVASSSFTYHGPAWWFFWLQVALWALIWVAGILWYLRIRRRRQSQWAAHTAGAPRQPSAPVNEATVST